MNAYLSFFENKGFWFQAFFLLFFIVIGGMLFTLVGQLCSHLIWRDSYELLTSYHQANYIRLNQFFSMIGVWLVPSLFFSFAHDRKVLSYNRANRFPAVSLVKWVCIMAVVILPIVYLLAYWNQQVVLPETLSSIEHWMKEKEQLANQTLDLLTANLGLCSLCSNLLILGIMPAVCEEFFFQGTIQVLLTKCLKNNNLGIWMTAILFSAIHLQFYGFIPRLLLGAYLGYLFVWSRSLWLPILAHMLHNVLSLLFHFVSTKQGFDAENLSFTSQQWFYIGVLLTMALLLTILGINKMRKESKEDRLLSDFSS